MDWRKTAAQLKIDEGFRGKAYLDSVGVLTIGYGRNLEAIPLSPDEAEYLFANDLRRAHEYCLKIPVFQYLNDVRQEVLVNMMYNMGPGTLGTFKNFLAALAERSINVIIIRIKRNPNSAS